MNPEKQDLIHDSLDPQRDTRREVTLLAGGHVLRRRRQRRVAFRMGAAVMLLALATLSLHRLVPRAPAILTMAPSPPTVSPLRSLTDAQLLALFPDTPVGLVTLENGRKRLIFPRPGDEERFVKHL